MPWKNVGKIGQGNGSKGYVDGYPDRGKERNEGVKGIRELRARDDGANKHNNNE